MSDINELGERVATAEERFRFINEVQNKHSERLLGLLNKLKSELDDTRQLHEEQKREIDRLTAANESLRGLLHNLLRAVENFNNSDVFQGIERKAAGLLSSTESSDVGKAESEVSDLTEARKQITRSVRSEETAARTEPNRKREGDGDVVELASEKPDIPTFFLRKDAGPTPEAEVKN